MTDDLGTIACRIYACNIKNNRLRSARETGNAGNRERFGLGRFTECLQGFGTTNRPGPGTAAARAQTVILHADCGKMPKTSRELHDCSIRSCDEQMNDAGVSRSGFKTVSGTGPVAGQPHEVLAHVQRSREWAPREFSYGAPTASAVCSRRMRTAACGWPRTGRPDGRAAPRAPGGAVRGQDPPRRFSVHDDAHRLGPNAQERVNVAPDDLLKHVG
jgi:hypothetical protein